MNTLLARVALPTLVTSWLPPSREHWKLIVRTFTLFPVFETVQWFIDWYPQGKTSVTSRFNLPGKWGWALMETPGWVAVLYCMFTVPHKLGLQSLPVGNWTMAGLYTLHYMNRAYLSPLVLQPSMAPIHAAVVFLAIVFNVLNGLSIGGWLSGYGPTTALDWNGRGLQISLGLVLWCAGWLGNIYHDEELRQVRRDAQRIRAENGGADGSENKGNSGMTISTTADGRVYAMPTAALFQLVLYPHYLCEFVEWFGFWLIGGWSCAPARNFLLAEMATMVPRACQGWRWYVERFGREKVGDKKAIFPGLL